MYQLVLTALFLLMPSSTSAIAVMRSAGTTSSQNLSIPNVSTHMMLRPRWTTDLRHTSPLRDAIHCLEGSRYCSMHHRRDQYLVQPFCRQSAGCSAPSF